MNYTEKYHLPQWEESDRVMRTDFNQMCSSIENGLAAGAQGTEAAEELTFERLCRLAYNHYHHVRTLETMPRQMGVLHQRFGKNAGSVNGMERREDCCFMGMGTESFDGLKFFGYMNQVSALKIVKGGAITPLVVTFTAPGPGLLSRFFIDGTFSGGTVNTYCHVVLNNLTTGQQEASAMIEMKLVSTGGGWIPITTDLYFHGGYDYEIRVRPTSAVCNANLHLPASLDGVNGVPTAVSYMSGAAQTAFTFPENEESQGGVALVCYETFGPETGMTLLWDGEAIEPYRVRTITEGTKTVLEAEYRRNDPVPAGSGLELSMNCGVNSEITLYRWGAVLL